MQQPILIVLHQEHSTPGRIGNALRDLGYPLEIGEGCTIGHRVVLHGCLIGANSMIGMGALSTVIAVPLAVSARWLNWANSGLQGAVGIVTVAIGIRTIVANVFT